MSERFSQTKITADPSKSSLREEVLSIKPKGLERTFSIPIGPAGREEMIYTDDEIGENFHKIDPKLASSQKLLSLILKGVINVSDIVRVGDDYYSHEQNFDHIEPGKEDIIAEVTADLFIIGKVFGDSDHKYFFKNSYNRTQIEREHPNSVLEHHNLRVDEANQKLNFFDFETYGNDWVDKIKNLKNKVVKLLANLFTSNKFDIFKKIVERSGAKLTENEQQILFNNITLRLQILNKELSKIKVKQ